MDDQKPVEPSEEKMQTAEEVIKPEVNPKKFPFKLAVILFVTLLVVSVAGFLLYRRSGNNESDQNKETPITSFAECVAAGNPVQESSPEQCSANGKTFKNEAIAESEQENIVADEDAAVAEENCGDGETVFSDEDFGAKFCYPEEWGTASVMDAKIDSTDTGHREAVRFSANTKFIVGGTSDDWTTTIGRGVACQEPNNNVPELSSYNTEWHDIMGEGMAVEFAQRSLESTAGGYDMTETVSNLLDSGVCAQGHKVINGSRYRVMSAAYYSDFSEASGITTPKAHMDNPTVLFSNTQREQFDALLESIEAF